MSTIQVFRKSGVAKRGMVFRIEIEKEAERLHAYVLHVAPETDQVFRKSGGVVCVKRGRYGNTQDAQAGQAGQAAKLTEAGQSGEEGQRTQTNELTSNDQVYTNQS